MMFPRGAQVKLLPLRADEMTPKRSLCCAVIVLSIVVCFMIIFGSYLPDYSVQVDSVDCSKLNNMERQGQFCQQFDFNGLPIFQTYVMEIDEYSQFLMIDATPFKSYFNRPLTVQKNITMNLIVEEVREDFYVTRVLNVIREYNQIVSCDFTAKDEKTCSAFTMLFIPQIDPGSYRITFQVSNMADLTLYMAGIRLEAYTVNSDYYKKYLAVRYIFFIFSLFLYGYYCWRYCSIPKGLKVMEQDFVLFLVPALALFNNPLLYMNIAMPSKFSIFVSVICSVVFISILWLFWAVLFERIYKENDKKACQTIQWWKLSISAVI